MRRKFNHAAIPCPSAPLSPIPEPANPADASGKQAIVGPGYWHPGSRREPDSPFHSPADRPCVASVQAPTSSTVTPVA